MRHVGLEDFLKMPEGTVYMIDNDNIHGIDNVYDIDRPLRIKGTTIPGVNDWFEYNLINLNDDRGGYSWSELMRKMISDGENLPVESVPICCRHGEFPGQGDVSFFVLDRSDVISIVGILQQAFDL